MAALEALAAGVPVLASKVGGLTSLIKDNDNGWLFEPGNINEAVTHIATWQRLPQDAQERLRRKSRKTVDEQYSDAMAVPLLLESYRRAGLPPRK